MRVVDHLLAASLALTGLLADHAVAVESKYCDKELNLCFAEFRASKDTYFRIAIPERAQAPFDVVLQMEAPNTLGWLGFAWGGQMLNNPITLAWPSGDSVIVTARHATKHELPPLDSAVNATRLRGSFANTTHWKANILCQGCSSWKDSNGELKHLDPHKDTTWFAWADGRKPPLVPADSLSPFDAHTGHGFFPFDLSKAQQPRFQQAVAAARPNTLEVAQQIAEAAIRAAQQFGAAAIDAARHVGTDAVRTAERAGAEAITAAHDVAKGVIKIAEENGRPDVNETRRIYEQNRENLESTFGTAVDLLSKQANRSISVNKLKP